MAAPVVVGPRPGRWATAANALTSVRLASALPLALAVDARAASWAALLVAVAIATDFADGAVARRRGQSSALGGLFDHASDAIFVTAGLAAFAQRGMAPGLLAPLVAAAFVQYVLDSRSLAGRPLRASTLGRWNGIGYFVLVAAAAGSDAVGLGASAAPWLVAMGWGLAATTALSMADRLVALRRQPVPSGRLSAP